MKILIESAEIEKEKQYRYGYLEIPLHLLDVEYKTKKIINTRAIITMCSI